jgi:GDP-mannose 6-dehydrogenase
MGELDSGSQPAVAVLGLGYVGCVTAACLAHLGHRVVGVDRDEHKVSAIRQGVAPFFEPGLGEWVGEGVAKGLLSASSNLAEVLPGVDVVLVCVGTPSDRNGNLGLDQLRRVCEEIARCRLPGRPMVLAIRSTVFPGTCEEIVQPIMGPEVRVVSNPEFLREGSAMRDFMEPSLIVVGGDDRAAVEVVAGLYRTLPFDTCRVSLRTAEMIKYTCNAFHAVKIGFANEVGTLCGKLGVDADEVMATVCRDVKLNISPAYLKPGFAFGGSCLPKDMRAIVYRAKHMDVRLPLLESVLPSNREHLERGIEAALALPGRIGIYGLAFKENTDDLRESPVITIVEQLIGKGREVRIFDPHIRLEEIYGSNLNFVMRVLPHIGRIMVRSADELLAWSERIIVAQKANADFSARLITSKIPALDLTAAPTAASPELTYAR